MKAVSGENSGDQKEAYFSKTHGKRSWIFVILWMIFIFVMSAMPSDESSEQSGRVVALFLAVVRFLFGQSSVDLLMSGPLEFVIRKIAHFTEYCILYLLVNSAMRQDGVKHHRLFSLLFCSGYACTDEVHQYFVPGRSMELRDVGIDTLGAATGMLFMLAWDAISGRFKVTRKDG